MKYFLICSFVLLVSSLFAQCDCPPLPDPPTGIQSDTASTMASFEALLDQANARGGNSEIILEPGIYQITSNLRFIDAGIPHLTIRSSTGNPQDVVIRGNGMTGNVSHIFSVAADHFTLADVTIGWVANHAIQIRGEDDADHAIIHNVHIYDVREQLIKGSGSASGNFSDSCIVECCHFEFTEGQASQWYTGGIDVHSGGSWIVRYNTFLDIKSPDQGLAEHAIHFWSNSFNTLVENNLIIDCDRGIGFGLGDRGHDGGIIRNNMVHTSRDVGIGLESSPNTKIYNNTVVTENYFNSIEYRFEATVNAEVINNLVNENIANRSNAQAVVSNNYRFNSTDIFEDYTNHDYHLSIPHDSIVKRGLLLSDVSVDYDCDIREPAALNDIGADQISKLTTSTVSYLDKIKPSPNPAHGILLFNLSSPVKYQIKGLSGKAIIKGHGKSVDVGRLPPGIYFLSLDSSRTYKFIKV